MVQWKFSNKGGLSGRDWQFNESTFFNALYDIVHGNRQAIETNFDCRFPYGCGADKDGFRFSNGAVEKSRQRRSHQFSVLTYWKYAPRTKLPAALLDELF
jgi:hypothetical protein